MGTPTWELMVSQLSAHSHTVHRNAGGNGTQGAGAGPAPRLEILPVKKTLGSSCMTHLWTIKVRLKDNYFKV